MSKNDDDHVEQFEDVAETFFGLTKAKFVAAVVIALIATINVTSFLVWSRINGISKIQEQNQRALAHLCVTQTAVELVLAQAVKTVETIGVDKLTLEQKRLYRIEKEQLAEIRNDAACLDVVH